MKRMTLLLLLLATSAAAQEYPSKPVRMIAPFPATGGVDIVARQIAQKLSDKWKQQVVVDNRPGATGIIGTDLAAKATADGYTILMGNVATQAVNLSLYNKLPYDPVRDFESITLVARVPEMLVVNPSNPAKSVKDLIALAQTKQLTFGSAGSGSPPHLAGELFQHLAKVQFVHVPYKGSAPALIDLIGGQIDLYFANILSAMAQVKGGKLRPLGVTSAKRAVVAPDVPTIAEAGLPGYEEYNWYGLLAPRGTPKAIVNKLNTDIVAVLRSPDMQERLTRDGAEVIASTPDEFTRFVKSEIAKYAQVIKARGLKAAQ
jgi:tripartite-type tricarboxylate transporter receptor subunit TctC